MDMLSFFAFLRPGNPASNVRTRDLLVTLFFHVLAQ